MEDFKQKIVITLPYQAGGVAIVIKNILKYIDHKGLYFHVILIKKTNNQFAEKPDNFNADKISVFEYSRFENKYSVFKRFCKLIPNEALVITNDYFELQAINALKRKNKIIHIVHGSGKFNFENIKKYQGFIDVIISVSKYIDNKIKEYADNNIRHAYIAQPVTDKIPKRKNNFNEILKILYVGRLAKEKGVFDLVQIDKILKKNKINVQWTIVGFGKEQQNLQKIWNNPNILWKGKLKNEEVLEIYQYNDLIVLPSHSEGFPVVIIEAMKAGLIPLVSDLPSGIPEIIKNQINGYIFPLHSPEQYAKIIQYFDKNRKHLEKISQEALKTVQKKFNSTSQAEKYKKIISDTLKTNIQRKIFIKEKLGILDKSFIPNFITYNIRNIIN